MADLEQLPHPLKPVLDTGTRPKGRRPRPFLRSVLDDTMDDIGKRMAAAMAATFQRDLGHLLPPRTPLASAHRQAEVAVLEAAVRHQRAQADLKERGGYLSVRNEAAAAHLLLDRAAVAYGEAHAALVAAS